MTVADLGVMMERASYSASDRYALHRFIENLTRDRNRRAALREFAAGLIETEVTDWANPSLQSLKFRVGEEHVRLLKLDEQPPGEPSALEWNKKVGVSADPTGSASVAVVFDKDDGIFLHAHYGDYGYGFRLTEPEALDLTLFLMTALRDLRAARGEKEMSQAEYNRVVQGQQGVGATPKDWYIIERRNLFMISPPPKDERWHNVTEPIASASECIHVFESRWKDYQEQGYDVRPVFTSGIRDHDSVQIYENADPQALLMAELKIVGIDRPPHHAPGVTAAE